MSFNQTKEDIISYIAEYLNDEAGGASVLTSEEKDGYERWVGGAGEHILGKRWCKAADLANYIGMFIYNIKSNSYHGWNEEKKEFARWLTPGEEENDDREFMQEEETDDESI
jgi:hypothetical protein